MGAGRNSASVRVLRRFAVPLTAVAALLVVQSAAAAKAPTLRSLGAYPVGKHQLFRHGKITIPAGHSRALTTVIVDLNLPSLAVENAQRDGVSPDHLDIAARSSQAYLARVDSAQRAAVAQLHAVLPDATVPYRYRVIMDALAIRLPNRQVPTLMRQSFVRKVYPNVQYTQDLNKSPSVIGADVLEAATGAKGDGIKIGVVDDGVDQTNPFFNPAGYQYPPGFPKGVKSFTTPKVIVARSFPGPGSGHPGTLPVDRSASFHGTHVAGIAAGDAGTNAPPGRDHPAVAGLSGIAPRAYIGNYRVFNTPTPVGNSATTAQIIAAFESAVQDGMQVINFSGGAPELEPVNDALIEATHGTTLAGVVVAIAAGNDRADFGLGSVGTPGTAPDAITVAAVSNTHVFAQALTVSSPAVPGGLPQIPFQPSLSASPPTWASSDQTLIDVTTIKGTDGKPVDGYLCGTGADPNVGGSKLPKGSLSGAIALVLRGKCSFYSKSQRVKAAGAIGIIYIDNRPGETSIVPVPLIVPGGMIADLDGAKLRAAMASAGGRAKIKIGVSVDQIETGRAGIPAYFSSAGPTSYAHALKPDIAAPGQQILSSTLPEFAGSPFAVFDGTSMATPHIAGASAILLQLHPGWTPAQVKSALMDTARPAYADTGRTEEAPVLLEGAGMAYMPTANDPKIFTDPMSVSLPDVDVNHGAANEGQLIQVSDAGGGAGTWTISVQPQSATPGAGIDVPGMISIPPGGVVSLPVAARVTANATPGEQFGFIVLTRGADTRRIPYFFLVSKPGLEGKKPIELAQFQVGSTVKGTSRANVYKYPSLPFGPAANFIGPSMNEDGAEKLYILHLNRPAANFGAAVIAASNGALIDPWALGSPDEDDVLGYMGTPVNVNAYMFDYKLDVGAAGQQYPQQGLYYLSVDSGRDRLTNKRYAGSYLLRAWANDVTPPQLQVLTTRVSAGRPMIVARILDAGSGVDPFSIVFNYGRVLIGAVAYDPFTGLAFLPIPPAAPALPVANVPTISIASDYQETKNLDQASANPLPNTAFTRARLRIVSGPSATWLEPATNQCETGNAQLLVTAGSTKKLAAVAFFDGSRKISVVHRGVLGLYAAAWKTGQAAKGKHVLRMVAVDAAGRTASATRVVRVCRK
jgi:minor extracellular serine protease Vpr